MPNCDNCGVETGYSDRNFTDSGGALCDRCRQINRVHVLADSLFNRQGVEIDSRYCFPMTENDCDFYLNIQRGV